MQALAVVDLAMLEHARRLAGMAPAEAAPGLLVHFRAVECLFIRATSSVYSR